MPRLSERSRMFFKVKPGTRDLYFLKGFAGILDGVIAVVTLGRIGSAFGLKVSQMTMDRLYTPMDNDWD